MDEDNVVAEVDPLIGRELSGRYRVVERIGHGGMGRVYRAIQSPLDRPVALKVVVPHYGDGRDPNFYKRFFLEASVTSKLSHPNTITIFDYGKTDDGLVFIAMEYLQGRTLGQLLATEGAQPPARAVHIAAQVARSLREAHEMGVIHRDLKPANVMLLKHGEDEYFVKVLDFGLVKFFGAEREMKEEEEELTQNGTFLGSPQYMAPEQAGQKADPRSDVYSLGIILYHMIAGRVPFKGSTIAETILKHVHDPVPPLQQRAPQPVPADLEAIVMKSLAKRPDQRFESMAEFLAALKRCSVGEYSGAHSGPIGVTPPPLPRKQFVVDVGAPETPPPLDQVITAPTKLSRTRTAAYAGSGVALALVVATALYFLAQRSTPQSPAPSAETPAARPSVEPPPPTPAPEPAPAPKLARFRVVSDPPKAQVYDGGELIGETPFELERTVEGADVAIKLRVSLFGFEPQVVEASSAGGDSTVNVKLKKREYKPKPAAPVRSGYKDDPY